MRYCGRPFFTVENCDEAMIERWNATVRPEDTVFHMGDVAMKLHFVKKILPLLNGKKILIVGNHDLMYDYFIKTRGQKYVDQMYDEYKKAGFAEVHKSGYEIAVNGHTVRLCHFPTKNSHDNYHDNKHDAARPFDNGQLNICGHVHQSWLKRGNNVNVGVDVWDFTPVSLETVFIIWFNGQRNVETPHQTRIKLWTLFHTAIWKLKNLFPSKELPNGRNR